MVVRETASMTLRRKGVYQEDQPASRSPNSQAVKLCILVSAVSGSPMLSQDRRLLVARESISLRQESLLLEGLAWRKESPFPAGQSRQAFSTLARPMACGFLEAVDRLAVPGPAWV